jgi:hypothetical protein
MSRAQDILEMLDYMDEKSLTLGIGAPSGASQAMGRRKELAGQWADAHSRSKISLDQAKGNHNLEAAKGVLKTAKNAVTSAAKKVSTGDAHLDKAAAATAVGGAALGGYAAIKAKRAAQRRRNRGK